MRVLLFVFAALVWTSCASAPGSGSFFQTTPHRYALDRAEQAAPSEDAQEAAEARVSAALQASSVLTGGTYVTVEVSGRLIESGEIEVSRDTLGRVRGISHTALTFDASGERTSRTYTKHWFDESGHTAGFFHLHQTDVAEACPRPVSGRVVDLWLDRGRLVSVDHRLSRPVTACTPARPAGQTALIFPDAESFLAASGVTDLDALPWKSGVPPPASPRS